MLRLTTVQIVCVLNESALVSVGLFKNGKIICLRVYNVI